MFGRPIGFTLLAAMLFSAGLAGIAAFWVAWPRNSNTSPLASLLAIVWSCTYIVSALLIWRRSRFAAPAFLVAIGLMLPLFWFAVPEGQTSFLVFCAAIFLCGLLGYRYLSKKCESIARHAR